MKLRTWTLEPPSSREASVHPPSPPPIHQAFHGTGLADIHHEPIRYPKPTPRLRQSFAAVPQAPQQFPSQRRVSKCCSEPTRRILGVACRVPGWREPPNPFSSTRAQYFRRFSCLFQIMRAPHSRNTCTNSEISAATTRSYRNRICFQAPS